MIAFPHIQVIATYDSEQLWVNGYLFKERPFLTVVDVLQALQIPFTYEFKTPVDISIEETELVSIEDTPLVENG